ncbi:MAG: hypothetical protein ACI8SJ_002700 [Shewanella sp.]|jgi:hypothetical protein
MSTGAIASGMSVNSNVDASILHWWHIYFCSTLNSEPQNINEEPYGDVWVSGHNFYVVDSLENHVNAFSFNEFMFNFLSAEDLSQRDSIGSELGEKAEKPAGFIHINRMVAGFYCDGRFW